MHAVPDTVPIETSLHACHVYKLLAVDNDSMKSLSKIMHIQL